LLLLSLYWLGYAARLQQLPCIFPHALDIRAHYLQVVVASAEKRDKEEASVLS
jgi:hypothetical protein